MFPSRLRLQRAFALVVVGLALVVPTPRAVAWQTRYHAALAVRAVECWIAQSELPSAPPAASCRAGRFKSLPPFGLLERMALREGAEEPDYFPPRGDSFGSSKHSLNPRLFREPDPTAAIRKEYGAEISATDAILEGKAVETVKSERAAAQKLVDEIVAARRLCEDVGDRYLRLWKQLGRVSHYVSDLHSPFHAPSFGTSVGSRDLQLPGGVKTIPWDYHEGEHAPPVWIRGLWDRGTSGRIDGHGALEWSMGAAAPASTLECPSCQTPSACPTDLHVMAEQAYSTMDSYAGPLGLGYRGLLNDFSPGQDLVSKSAIESWGRPRATAAIGSIQKIFGEILEPLLQEFPSCDPQACLKRYKTTSSVVLQGPGGDNPDDNFSTDLGRPFSLLAAEDQARADSRLRLAAKKGLREIVDQRLASEWAEASFVGELSIEKAADYTSLLPSNVDAAQRALASRRAADVAVLDNGFSTSASEQLEQSLREPTSLVAPDAVGPSLRLDHPVLLVPSGGLSGLGQSEMFRAGLEAYVREGGTALVFSQQYGADFRVLPTPDGRPIGAWGWLQDNACYTNAAYVAAYHPALASVSGPLVTSQVDGYFDSIPDTATVLLRRAKNNAATFFIYPYGLGWVAVTSSYDDWGGPGYAPASAVAIIRDTIAWAKHPTELQVHAPGTTAAASLRLRNTGSNVASQVRLELADPWRSAVVEQRTVPLTLGPGAEVDQVSSFTLPARAERRGIYHVDYELLDDAGVVIQPKAEADSGRLVSGVAPDAAAYVPRDIGVSLLIPDGEVYLAGQTVRFVYRISNRTASERRVRTYWDNGRPPEYLHAELTLPPSGFVEREVPITAGFENGGMWIHVVEEGGVPREPQHGFHVPGETWAYQYGLSKGYQVRRLAVEGRLVADRELYLKGEEAQLFGTVRNAVPIGWSGVLRASCSDGRVLREMPVDLPAGGTLPFEPIRFTVQESTWCGVTVTPPGQPALGAGGTSLRVLTPELVSEPPDLPLWSRTTTNRVSWTLANRQPVPLASGVVAARLAELGGRTLWEDELAFALPAGPGASQTFSFDIPPLPDDAPQAFLRLTAENGFGRTVESRSFIRREFRAGVVSAPNLLSAGDTGAFVLRLQNTGTTLEEGSVSATLEDIGGFGAQAYSLLPGQTLDLTLSFGVPADARGGRRAGQLSITGHAPLVIAAELRRPTLEFSPASLSLGAGQTAVIRLANRGGTRARAQVEIEPQDLPRVAAIVELDPGAEERFTVPIPAQHPTQTALWRVSAADLRTSASGGAQLPVTIAGTQATLEVRTDRAFYAPGAALEAGAGVHNGPRALVGGLLHLEIRSVCFEVESSYHFDTWDGSDWVERGVRHLGGAFETGQIDLSAFLPDPEGEHKVRIRQLNAYPAEINWLALASGGALVAPLEAQLDTGEDVLGAVEAADDVSAWVPERTLEVRFPAAAGGVLVYRAREGSESCPERTLWQLDVPLDLASGASRAVAESLLASPMAGEYALVGTVLTRDGAELAQRRTLFQVVDGPVGVSVGSDRPRYRPGDTATIAGSVTSLSPAEETRLRLLIHAESLLIHEESFDLPAGQQHAFSVTYARDPFWGTGEVRLRADVERENFDQIGRGQGRYQVATPQISAKLRVPDPPLRLEASSGALVALDANDLDGALTQPFSELVEALPFAVELAGQRYTSFRQTTDGVVELVPEVAAGPVGSWLACLQDAGDAAVLAADVAPLDPSATGFVGYRLFAAGSSDRAGRRFEEDTLVFAWEAPDYWSSADVHRSQVQLAKGGLTRLVAPAATAPLDGCVRAGASLWGRAVAAPAGPAVNAQVVSGVGRGRFRGTVEVVNSGDDSGTVQLDYGRVDGTRQQAEITLAAGESRLLELEDSVAAATTYSLVASGADFGATQTTLRRVDVGEGFVARYVGSPSLAPGPVSLSFSLTKTGLPAPVSVSFRLTGPVGAVTETRVYDLEAGLATLALVPFTLVEGLHRLEVEAEGVPIAGDIVTLTVLPRERVSMVATAGAATGGGLPFLIDVTNSGLDAFAGRVEVEGRGGAQATLTVAPGASQRVELRADLSGAAAGELVHVVRLVSGAGAVLAERELRYLVRGADLSLDASPAGQSFDAGSVAAMRFVLHNAGDTPAAGFFRFELFDEERVAPFELAPGAEQELVFEFLIEAGVEARSVSGRYEIEGGGAARSGRIDLRVEGIALSVNAALDQPAYRDGDTARLSVEVLNATPLQAVTFEARVHYAGHEESRRFDAGTSASLVFEIPVARVTGEPLSLTVGTTAGLSLYINSFELRGDDALAHVRLDQQVYAPGGSVAVTAAPEVAGRLTLAGPGFVETLEASGAVARSFDLPASLPGGTYAVTWSFAAQDGRSSSGSVPFGVRGLRVRVIEAALDAGRYESGATIHGRLLFRTNQAVVVRLRASDLPPTGAARGLGETTLALDPGEDLLAEPAWPFASDVAGLHRLFYEVLTLDDELLASGSLAFETGQAALVSVRTDRLEYTGAGTPVEVSVSAFLHAAARLRLELDGRVVETRELDGTGLLGVAITLDGLEPGSHELVAILEGGGSSSRARTTFVTGTSLADLEVERPRLRAVSGAAWSIDTAVFNRGRSASTPTTLVARDVDTGTLLGTAMLAALAEGESALAAVSWNVAGLAGSREIEVEVDPEHLVPQRRRENDRARARLAVPSLLIEAAAAPSYPANVAASLGALVTTLGSSPFGDGLVVTSGITTSGGGVVDLGPAPVAPLAPGASTFVDTPWSVGRTAPGFHVFSPTLRDAGGHVLSRASRGFDVEPTVSLTGSVFANPDPALRGAALELGGRIENRGNVALEGTARFDVVAADRTIVASTGAPFALPLEGVAQAAGRVDPLAASPGEYRLSLSIEALQASHPVAERTLVVRGEGLTGAIGSDLAARVLVWGGVAEHERHKREALVAQGLGAAGVRHRFARSPVEFLRLLRSGEWNVHVLWADTPLVTPLWADELREAVFRGDGLVLLHWREDCRSGLEEALGARVTSRLGRGRHRLSLLDEPLGPAATLDVFGPAARLQATTARVAATFEGGDPAIATHAFGRGRAVLFSFDPATPERAPDGGALSGLLARATAHVAPVAEPPPAPGVVLPLVVELRNESSSPTDAEVRLLLPPEVRLAGADEAPVSLDPVRWQSTVEAQASRWLGFRVIAPDAAGSFAIEVEITSPGLVDQASRVVSIEASAQAVLSGLIAELRATSVAASDDRWLRLAVARLCAAEALRGGGLMALEARIRLAVEAASLLGRIGSVPLGEARLSTSLLIAGWERLWFERSGGLGYDQLSR